MLVEQSSVADQFFNSELANVATISVYIDDEIIELIPNYIANKRADLETMHLLLAQGNYQQLWILADFMIGDGGSYGFDFITTIGRQLVKAIKLKQDQLIVSLLNATAQYFDKLCIISFNNFASRE